MSYSAMSGLMEYNLLFSRFDQKQSIDFDFGHFCLKQGIDHIITGEGEIRDFRKQAAHR